MKKKILSVALAAALVLSLTLAGCGSSDGGEKQGGNGKLVGVAMPTQSSEQIGRASCRERVLPPV